MALTGKQEAFAQAVASGMTQADAYRTAYECDNSSDAVVYNEASLLMSGHDISMRVKELREAIAIAAIWTRLDSVQALAEIAKGEETRANEKVSAIKELNAMHGFNEPTKVAMSVTVNATVNYD
jgi:predicted nucleotide-binding protein (sugar kinase/HSP70/actin superfamily)